MSPHVVNIDITRKIIIENYFLKEILKIPTMNVEKFMDCVKEFFK